MILRHTACNQAHFGKFSYNKLFLLVICILLLTGCVPNKDSLEGRSSRLEAALKTEKVELIIDLLQTIPVEERGNVIEGISFVSLSKYAPQLVEALEALDKRWRFDMKGFTIDYLKQVAAINSLEEAQTVEAKAPITIIEPCQTEQDVIQLYMDQLAIEGVNPIEDMYVSQGSISITWQYQKGSAQLSKLNMVVYNIVHKQFYQVDYKGSSLTITPVQEMTLNYNDLALNEASRIDYLQSLIPLVPPAVTAPVKLTLSAFNESEEAIYVGLPVALLVDRIYVATDQGKLRKSTGRLEIAWNPALEIPPQVGEIQKMSYHLGLPLEEPDGE